MCCCCLPYNYRIDWLIQFMHTYLKYRYFFFFISISGRIRSRNLFPAEPDPDQWKKMSDPHPFLDQYLKKKIGFWLTSTGSATLLLRLYHLVGTRYLPREDSGRWWRYSRESSSGALLSYPALKPEDSKNCNVKSKNYT